MTTQAKLILCAGLLALAVGVAFVCIPAAKPQVELRFIRHTNNNGAVLSLTNRGESALTVLCVYPEVFFQTTERYFPETRPEVLLLAHSGTQLVARPSPTHFIVRVATPGEPLPPPFPLPATISVRYWPPRSKLQRYAHVALQCIGAVLADTGAVATVQLPPR